MSRTVRLRQALAAVPAYKPGKPAATREDISTYKISSNENPYPPLPSVLKVVQDAATQMNRYPDMAVTELTLALARYLGVPPENIATGTGSVGVLGQLIAASCDPGDEVIYAWRSFEAYPILELWLVRFRCRSRSTRTRDTTSPQWLPQSPPAHASS